MRRIRTSPAGCAIGLALLAGAFGCGGKVGNESLASGPSSSAPGGIPTAPPPYFGSATPQPSVAPVPPEVPPGPVLHPRPSGIGDYDEDLSEAAAEDVLSANCGACHGPALAVVAGGIRLNGNWDELVEAGLIVPRSSATSRIILVMRDGSMPPPISGRPSVTEADIEIIAGFIDNPRYWLESPVPRAVDAGAEPPFFDAGADGG